MTEQQVARGRPAIPRWLRRLAGALLVLLATVLLLEGGARVGERLAYGAWYADGQPRGLYQRDTHGRLRLRPGAELPGWWYEVTINSLGFRGPELAPEKALPRVWCFGGSTTFDIYARDDASTWPALTGALLAEGGTAVEVINAGVPGEMLLGNLDDLKEYQAAVKPDVVVFYQGPNELRDVAAQKYPAAGPPVVPLSSGLFRVLERVAPRTTPQAGWAREGLNRRDMERKEGLIRAFVRDWRGRGARVVLATHALRASAGVTGSAAREQVAETMALLTMDGAAVVESFETWNAMIRDIAAEEGATLADVRAAVPPGAEAWGDATHFRRPGSERAAGAVAEAVRVALGAGGDRG